MFQLRFFSSLTVSVLVLQLIMTPLFARLPEKTTQTIKITLLALDKNPKTEKTLQAIRAELRGNSNLQILNLSNVSAVSSLASSTTQAQVSLDFRETIRQAQEFYNDFAFAKAVSVLQRSLDDYGRISVVADKQLSFSQLFVMMGNAYLADQNADKAKEAFARAVQCDPQYTISEREYPPTTVKLFEEVRQDFLQKTQYARLEIQSNPKAQVYLNGVLQGETPLKLAKQPVGEQWVLLARPGYRHEKLKIDLTTANFKKKIELETSKQTFDSLGAISPENQRLRTLSRWGNENGLDHIVTVQSDANNKIKIESIHVAKVLVENQNSFDFAKLSRELVNVRQNLVSSFEKVSNPTIASAAAIPASSEKPRSTKKKSIFKKPWLWGVLGAVVAGGAASAFLIGGGSSQEGPKSISTTVRGAQSPAP